MGAFPFLTDRGPEDFFCVGPRGAPHTHSATRATRGPGRDPAPPHVHMTRPRASAALTLRIALLLLASGTSRVRDVARRGLDANEPRASWIRQGRGGVVLADAQADDNPLSITTSTTTDGRECSVGPYGWFCDPASVDNDVKYYTAVPFEGQEPFDTPDGLVGAFPDGLPPLCTISCVDDCQPPCPVECVRAKFEARVEALDSGTAGVFINRDTHQFYVNPYNGSDAWPGTRTQPWETLKRAQAQVRFMRVQNTEQPDSVKLLDPVQIWIRSFDHAQTEDYRANGEENSRFMGFTILE